jgi:hypothetical protein
VLCLQKVLGETRIKQKGSTVPELATDGGLTLIYCEWGIEHRGEVTPVVLQHGYIANTYLNWVQMGIVDALVAAGRHSVPSSLQNATEVLSVPRHAVGDRVFARMPFCGQFTGDSESGPADSDSFTLSISASTP